jgi:hypothetical protein
LLAAGAVALKNFPDLWETLETTISKIDALSRDRNLAIHSYWTTTRPPDREIRPHPFVPQHKALRDDFETQFRELLGALGGYWLTLFDLGIDYFDRASRAR